MSVIKTKIFKKKVTSSIYIKNKIINRTNLNVTLPKDGRNTFNIYKHIIKLPWEERVFYSKQENPAVLFGFFERLCCKEIPNHLFISFA